MDPTNTNPETNPQPQPQPVAAPPPAATIVANGGVSERELSLQSELAREKEARRKAETDAAYAQDEARRLKEAQSALPAPAPKAKKSGWTLLHAQED